MGLLSFSTLLLQQQCYMYLRREIPSLRAPLLDKRTPPFPMTNTALKGLVSQTQVSAKVCETWFGRVIARLLVLL